MKLSLQRLLITAGLLTVTAMVVALIVRHAKHGFALYLGDVAWFTFLIGSVATAGVALCVAVRHVLGRRSSRTSVRLMRAPAKLTLAAALAVLLTSAAIITATATGQPGASVIRLTVPISAVRANETDVAPKGESPGDGFQESYTPARPGQVIRQDAIAIGTFDRGVFLGTITLRQGVIVYGGSTYDQDNTAYAILGGTGTYQGAQGTVTTHAISRTSVQVTITIEPR